MVNSFGILGVLSEYIISGAASVIIVAILYIAYKELH